MIFDIENLSRMSLLHFGSYFDNILTSRILISPFLRFQPILFHDLYCIYLMSLVFDIPTCLFAFVARRIVGKFVSFHLHFVVFYHFLTNDLVLNELNYRSLQSLF